MQLQLSTWPDVESYLTRSQGIVMPIGSTEQHGPNGLVGTDAICAEEVAKGIGDRTGAMVAPTISVGMAQHHLGFPGSMTLRPSTLIAVVRDMVESLAVHGFRRFFFINGHGGNIATLTAAFSEIYAGASLAPATGMAANMPAILCLL
jgi:creatinine amidohydrolase